MDQDQDRVREARDKLQDARDAMQTSVRNMANNITNTNPMENPIGMMLAGMAVGFLIGLLLPVPRFEAERSGPIAEDIRDRAPEADSEVMQRDMEVIKETIVASRETATGWSGE